jgi:hypothetical protein
MAAWLWWAWLQIWPNLAANVIWVPLAAAHHILMKRHSARLFAEHAEQQRKQLAEHVATVLGASPNVNEEV